MAERHRSVPSRKLQVSWKAKAAAFRLFDALPAGSSLYYLTQRHITRTIPRDLAEHGHWQFEHARVFRQWHGGDPGRTRLFEFGAGWDLHSSLVQWCYGIDTQVVVDISRLARPFLVNHAIAWLRDNPPPGGVRQPSQQVSDPIERSLRQHYGITYLAPADARHTSLDAGSIDLICTTSVLEHVPVTVLAEILQECHRIASPNVVMSHVVDYTDHFAHSDPTIGIFNFLRYTDREWQRYNPAIHYQNRLRHFEYGQLFDASGFVPLAVTVLREPPEALNGLPLAERFRGMSADQLLPRTGHWVLGKR